MMSIKDFSISRGIKLTQLKKIIFATFGEDLTELTDNQLDRLELALKESQRKALPFAPDDTPIETPEITIKQIRSILSPKELEKLFFTNQNLVIRLASETLLHTKEVTEKTRQAQAQIIQRMYVDMGKDMLAIHQEWKPEPVDMSNPVRSDKNDWDLIEMELMCLD